MLTNSHYHPFGMLMPGRGNTPPQSYRYGFNGKENDNEVSGNGNSLDFGARIYDSRLGRWLARDPFSSKYPYLSPFNFAGNNPLKFIDPNGKEIVNAEEPGTASWKKVDAAIQVIKKTNPKLYEELHAIPEKINISIGKLNPDNYYGATTNPTGRIEYGVANYSFETSGNLSITNISNDENGNPIDAQIQGKMTPNEQEEIRDKFWNEAGGDLNKYYELLEKTSFNKILNNEEASNDIKLYKDENGVIANIILDPLNIDKKSYSKTLAHELGHTRFAIFNTVKAWLWKSGNLGDPNTAKGKGHDPNNPNGNAANEAENECDKNY